MRSWTLSLLVISLSGWWTMPAPQHSFCTSYGLRRFFSWDEGDQPDQKFVVTRTCCKPHYLSPTPGGTQIPVAKAKGNNHLTFSTEDCTQTIYTLMALRSRSHSYPSTVTFNSSPPHSSLPLLINTAGYWMVVFAVTRHGLAFCGLTAVTDVFAGGV